MKQIILPVTVHLNIRLPLALLQPEPADAPTGPERRPMPARDAVTAAGAGSASMKKSKPEPIPVMDYRQYRRARRLVHECCNYDGGNCIALDDGEECVCVQSISYSLLCRWFRAAVLPLDKELETALFHRLDAKRCAVCGALFIPVPTGPNTARNVPDA